MIQLVKRAMQMDTDAFLELMEVHLSAMYKVAWAILRNNEDVADAVQDTILTCYEKLHTLKKPEYFKSWMTRILINHCYQIRNHYKSLDMEGSFPEIPSCDNNLAELEFKEMLNGLEEKYRIVLVLYYVEELKISEIAEVLEMNENTVKTRLTRAREKVKNIYLNKERQSGTVRNYQKTEIRNIENQGGIVYEKARPISQYKYAER